MAARAPSSSTEGFFQTLPTLPPQYTASENTQPVSDDLVLARLLNQYLPTEARKAAGKDIHDLSRLVLKPSTLQHAVDAESNPPTLQPFTTFGEVNRNDPLRTSQGWKALKSIGVEHGVVSRAYDKSKTAHGRRVEQFALNHAWSHTSTLTMCPMTMTDGAALLISKHLNDPDGDQPGRQAVFAESYRRLTSRDPATAWTSGQWMTERSGGSDVRGTETVARRLKSEELNQEEAAGQSQDAIGLPLGPWRIDGFKWFSSATDSEMTVLLAQTPKGLSAFYVPMRRGAAGGRDQDATNAATELNGIRIQRLKNKMGTRGLPTAELELVNTRGWLIGEEGKGVKEISNILNITRLHTAAGSASAWSRGLAVCRAYSKIRKVRGQFLYENSQHVLWMAAETVKYWAATSFLFFGTALLSCSEQGLDVLQDTPAARLVPEDLGFIQLLLRLLTPVMKAQVSMGAVSGLRSSMECLGGVGYCENHEDGGILNLAKLFRDSVVNTIWEGTVSVMADDVGRVIKDKRMASGRIIEDVFAVWVRQTLSLCQSRFATECAVVEDRLSSLVDLVQHAKQDSAQLEYHGRDLLDHLEAITCGAVLLFNASIDGDDVASIVASRYVWTKALPSWALRRPKTTRAEESAKDRTVFLGPGFIPEVPKGKL